MALVQAPRLSVKVVCVFGVLALQPMGFAAGLSGQRVDSGDRTAAEMIAIFRASNGNAPLEAVLGQGDRFRPQAFLDEVADSLAAIAIAGRREGALQANLVTFALHAIARGHTSPAARVPYAGAFQRLRRIHLESADPVIRSLALAHLVDVDEDGKGFAYARDFLASDDPLVLGALTAILFHADGGSQRALALLRQVYEEDLLRDAHLRSVLDSYAHWRDWRRRVPPDRR